MHLGDMFSSTLSIIQLLITSLLPMPHNQACINKQTPFCLFWFTLQNFPTTEFTTAGSSEDEDNSFITYMLIYFFATLGSLLLLTILVLGIAIIALRLRSSRTPKDTPLLSEEEKIAVMKQTGYVNPTYKFFDSSVKDVWFDLSSCTQPVDCHSFNPLHIII